MNEPLNLEFVEAIRQGFDNLLSPVIRRMESTEYNRLLDALVRITLQKGETPQESEAGK